MKTTTPISTLFLLSLFAGCGSSTSTAEPSAPRADTPASTPSVDWATWASWTKVNRDPFVSKGHKKPWVNVYVPAEHAPRYASLDGEMPRGFAVLKSVHGDEGGSAGAVKALTVMAKMGPDYDPDNGNWYYAVLSADASKVMQEGKLEMCIGCHSTGTDYLFGAPE